MRVLRDGPAAATEADYRERVRDLCARWREEGRYRPRSDAWLRSFDPGFSRELGALGLIGVSWPRAYGGGGATYRVRLAVTEELLRAGAPVAAHWTADRQVGPVVLRYGSDRLRAELLPRITAGEVVCAIGMSEPDAGSDLASVRTSARPAEGGWLLNGRKTWTSHAHHATHLYVLARTSRGERRHQGLSEFVVDTATPGIEVTPIVDMTGEHHFNEVALTDVFVPAHGLLGEPGNGWRQVTEQLSLERGGPERVLSTYPLVVEILARASGGPADPATAARIGELTARLAALRRLCRTVADALDRGEVPVQEAATLKYLGNRFEQDTVDLARDLGFSDGPLYRPTLLAAPAFALRGGAADLLLDLISRQEGSHD
ncbi:acyl-CoA dehydrogenase family protein [Actinomadura rugatobispora]|uniref:Acyl-CoA dehydrogenase family protein n=1 Tax=Actinomadura rugatobispora TaxID=1994 RepID=A0ABW1A1A0_9ACTN|nr:acyl-CoA dehydrogenase family protein [Actinomadura rugatobispora]